MILRKCNEMQEMIYKKNNSAYEWEIHWKERKNEEQSDMLELRISTNEMKNNFHKRLEQAEERILKTRDRSLEFS